MQRCPIFHKDIYLQTIKEWSLATMSFFPRKCISNNKGIVSRNVVPFFHQEIYFHTIKVWSLAAIFDFISAKTCISDMKDIDTRSYSNCFQAKFLRQKRNGQNFSLGNTFKTKRVVTCNDFEHFLRSEIQFFTRQFMMLNS